MKSLRCIAAAALAFAGAEMSAGQNVLPCDPYAQPDRRVADLDYSAWIADIEVVGDRIYVAADMIDVLELNADGVPHRLESWAISARSIEAQGGLFYVTTRAQPRELLILRPLQGEQPKVLSHTSVSHGEVAVQDTLALVGARIFDVSDPTQPQFLAEIVGPNGEHPGAVRLQLPYAHLVSSTGYLIEDLSDPSNPQRAGYLGSPWELSSLDIQGHYAYVSIDDAGPSDLVGLDIYDFSDPTHPVKSGGQWMAHSTGGVAAVGDRCYLTCDNGTLAIFELESPDRPRFVETQSLGGYSGYPVAVHGDFVLVGGSRGNGAGRLRVFDMSGPAWRPIRSIDEQRTGCTGLASSDEFLVTLHWNQGISIYRNAAGSLLHVVDADLPEFAWRAEISGDKLYVASQSAGLQIVQLSGANAGAIVARLNTSGGAEAIAIQDELAYVLESNQLLILDIQDPMHPHVVGSLALNLDYRPGIAVDGSIVYVVSDGHDLQSIDVSDPTLPRTISVETISFPPAGDVLIGGGIAYVVSNTESRFTQKLTVVDIADPNDMRVLAREYVFGTLTDAVLVGDVVYITSREHGVTIFDVSDPAAPRFVGSQPVPYGAQGIGVSHDRLYLAGSGGLFSGPLHHDCRDVFVDTVLDSIAPGGAGTLLGPAAGTQWNAPFGLTAYPNPSRGDTAVSYRVPTGSRLNLAIYDASGRIVRTLLDGAGSSVADGLVRWDGRDSAGKRAASGVYFVRIEAGGIEWKRKVVLLQ